MQLISLVHETYEISFIFSIASSKMFLHSSLKMTSSVRSPVTINNKSMRSTIHINNCDLYVIVHVIDNFINIIMEFDMQLDETSVFIQGNTTIDLPSHFILLPLAVIRESKDKQNIIIACGRKSPDGDVDFMLGNGNMMTISPKIYNIPLGKGVPIDGGKAIAFVQSSPVRLIDSKSLIECARTMIKS